MFSKGETTSEVEWTSQMPPAERWSGSMTMSQVEVFQ